MHLDKPCWRHVQQFFLPVRIPCFPVRLYIRIHLPLKKYSFQIHIPPRSAHIREPLHERITQVADGNICD